MHAALLVARLLLAAVFALASSAKLAAVSCGGIGVTLSSDPHTCGACGNSCPTGTPMCSGGV